MDYKRWFLNAGKNKDIVKESTKAVTSYSGQVTSITSLPEKIVITSNPVSLMKYNRGYIYAANHKISSALASLPYHLYTVIDADKTGKLITPHKSLTNECKKAVASSANKRLQDKQEMIEIYDHPILDLLKNPAPGWSQTEWFYVVSSYLGLIGNAYLKKIEDNSGQLIGLEPLMSEYVTIRYDRTGTITHYDYLPYGAIDTAKFSPSEIVHIRNRTAGSLIVGMGNLEACLQAFAVSQNAEQYAAALLNNMACPSGIFMLKNHGQLPIGTDGKPDETAAAAFSERLQEKYRGARRGTAMVTYGDIDYKALAVSMVDTQADKFMLEAKKQICACFSVPLSTLDETDSNKATALASMKQLKIFGVFPKVSLILDQLNAVFEQYFDAGLFVWIDQREALDPDPLEQSTVLSTLKNAGIMSINEARLTLGLPSLDGAEFDKPIAANASTVIQGQAIAQPTNI